MLPSVQNLKRKEETSLFASCQNQNIYWTVQLIVHPNTWAGEKEDTLFNIFIAVTLSLLCIWYYNIMQGTALCQIVYTLHSMKMKEELWKRWYNKFYLPKFYSQGRCLESPHLLLYIWGGAGFRYHIMAQKSLMLIGIGQIIIEH